LLLLGSLINDIQYVHKYIRKNDFVEVSKNLARYRFENNFVELSKIII